MAAASSSSSSSSGAGDNPTPGLPCPLTVYSALSLSTPPHPHPHPSTDKEESVEQFIRRNLGDEVFERLIEPFCSGVYAGDPSKLSMQAAFQRVSVCVGGCSVEGVSLGDQGLVCLYVWCGVVQLTAAEGMEALAGSRSRSFQKQFPAVVLCCVMLCRLVTPHTDLDP
jgi:hypothetical protein